MTWTKIFLEKSGREYHWVCLTNDDNCDGRPDGFICVTQGFGPLDTMLEIFGGVDPVGRQTDIYVDGVKR
jgi:hypothetical protein